MLLEGLLRSSHQGSLNCSLPEYDSITHPTAKSKNLSRIPLFQAPYRPSFGPPSTLQTCPRRPRACAGMNGSHSKPNSERGKKPYGYWKRLPNVLSELEHYLSSKNPRPTIMPTAHELAEAGRQDLAGAIRRHTWRKVAEAANLPLSCYARPRSLNLSFCTEIRARRMRPHMYWRDWNNVEKEIREFIQERRNENSGIIGNDASVMPTAAELVDHGRSDLKRAVLLHGGTQKVANRMGLVPKSRPIDYWNEESVVEELYRVVKCTGKEGEFPTLQDIRQFGARGLRSALRRYGGARALATQMGLTLRRRPPKR